MTTRTAPQHLVCRVVQSLHINHMQMSIIEVFICRRLYMNTSMILICIWLICRLCTALHTKCCGAVPFRSIISSRRDVAEQALQDMLQKLIEDRQKREEEIERERLRREEERVQREKEIVEERARREEERLQRERERLQKKGGVEKEKRERKPRKWEHRWKSS